MGRITTYYSATDSDPTTSYVVPGPDEHIYERAVALVAKAAKEGRTEWYVIEESNGIKRSYIAEQVCAHARLKGYVTP
jgi:hypothetical protein